MKEKREEEIRVNKQMEEEIRVDKEMKETLCDGLLVVVSAGWPKVGPTLWAAEALHYVSLYPPC